MNFIGSIAYYFRDILRGSRHSRGLPSRQNREKPNGRPYQVSQQLNTGINTTVILTDHCISNFSITNGFCKISEQPSLYNDLEKKSVGEILHDINNEDKKVALAVEKAIPAIEKLVEQIVPRMKGGGRIFYIGAGTSGRLGVLDASEIPPTFGMDPSWVIGLIAGGDTALRNPVENAEDDTLQGWHDLEKFDINDKDTVIGIAAREQRPM